MDPQSILQTIFLGGAGAALAFVAALVVAGIANIVMRAIAGRLRRRNPDSLAAEIMGALRGAIALFIVICGLFIALLMLTTLATPVHDIIQNWGDWIRKAWLATAIVHISYMLHRALDTLLDWYVQSVAENTETQLDDRLIPPLRRVLPLLMYSVGGLTALAAVNIPITPILAGFGIGGLAIALAVRPTLANFVAGTYVVTEGSLKVDDYIELHGGPAGYVQEIGWRSSKIRTMYNNLVIIPNSRMADSIITNYNSPEPAIDVLVYCGVSYDSDLQRVERVARAAAQDVVDASEHAIKDSAPWFGFEEFGDSNISFWIFIRASDRLGSFHLTSELVKLVHSRLTEEGIEINYPVRRLIFPPDQAGVPPVPPQPPVPPPPPIPGDAPR